MGNIFFGFTRTRFLNLQGLWSVLLFAGMVLQSGIASAAIIYVNVNNLNPVQDGTSWKTAYTSLQSALNQAEKLSGSNDIWVAKGTYFPTEIYSPNGVVGGAAAPFITPPSNISFLTTFNVPDGVSIFGGFNGTETRFKQRDPEKNPTVLSGAAGTSWHVVILGNDIAQTGVTVELNGLIITKGDAEGPTGSNSLAEPFTFGHSYGGGVYAAFGSVVTIKDVLFVENAADQNGGAFFSNNCTVNIERSRFTFNWAGTEAGGVAIFNTFETSPHIAKIKSSTFEGNVGVLFGGALVLEGTIQNSNSSTTVDCCNFKYNTSQIGGAIAVDSIKVNVLNSTFDTNIASVAGGALSTTNVVNTIATGFAQLPLVPLTTTVSRCKFIENVAQGNQELRGQIFGGPAASGVEFPLGGGAISVYINGYLDVNCSEFVKNVAQNSPGGAILNGNSAGENIAFSEANGFIVRTRIKNSTFVENRSPTDNGGAIASLPSTFFPSLPITVESTFLATKESTFKSNVAGLNGGAIYLNFSTAHLKKNDYVKNQAALGRSIYAINSIINGNSTSPFIKP